MSNCLICQGYVTEFHDFGRMPIANGFIDEKDFEREYFFNLKVGFCESCKMVQLVDLVDREKLFHSEYPFFTSSSAFMVKHFKELASSLIKLLPENAFVVEIGSNDGTTLQNFKGCQHLGVEPSANVAAQAEINGVNTWCKFFDSKLAEEIKQEYRTADAILATNVLCHIPDLNDVLSGIKSLLSPTGVFIFEDPYIGDILKKSSYDQIYDEHVFYFSVTSMAKLMDIHDLQIIGVERHDVHGGSLRFTVAHKDVFDPLPEVCFFLEQEKHNNVDRVGAYIELSKRIDYSKESLLSVLNSIRDMSVCGYAATSKSTTVTNYCGITPDMVPYICDTTPEKQGKYSPGVHIPVVSHSKFEEKYPDFALLFAWNHSKEIMEKESKFKDGNGKWVVYVPNVKIVGKWK
tara:strand:- start:2820 stop:4031 length:1212 start_codon:yes stop_codon:yes gene_type:complete